MNTDNSTGPVDWSKPIEAVRNIDGTVFPVTLSRDTMCGFYVTNENPSRIETKFYWNKDGSDPCCGSEWYVRNRVEDAEHAPKTLRDEFAMAALVGLISHAEAVNIDGWSWRTDIITGDAYQYADEMMEARK